LIGASEVARDAEVAEADKVLTFDDRQHRKELAEQAHQTRLSRIDDLADRFAEIESRADATAEFREMTRILTEERDNPVEKALTFAEQGRKSRYERIRARQRAEQSRNRAELQVDLKAASAAATSGRSDVARKRFEEVLQLEPDWPEAIESYAWYLYDQSIQSEQHGTLREALVDGRQCLGLAERLEAHNVVGFSDQRILSIAHCQLGDLLAVRGQPGDAVQALNHY